MRAAVVITLAVLAAPLGADTLGDVAVGEKLFSQCKGCHQVGPDAKNRIGPHLNALFGRKAGALDDFRYSKALARAASGGLEWHADTIDAFLENPRALISGTRMSYRGMKDPQARANLIAYLRTFSDNPSDIPEADPTAMPTDHALDPAILALEGDAEYGAYLASECTSCHRSDGADEGIPSITYWPEQDFVIALHAYKNQTRAHPAMRMIAGRLNDEEIAALAAYFADPEE